MRPFFPLFVLIGCLLAQTTVEAWDVNHEYIYRYEGRVSTGPLRQVRALNQGDNIRIVADLSVRVLNQQFLILQLRNARFQSADIHLADEHVRQLEAIFYAALKNGSVRQFTSLTRADWVLNFHKSLLSLISVRYPDGRGSLPSSGPWDGRSPVSYHAVEDEITGVCENSYDVSSVSEFRPRRDASIRRMRRRFCAESSSGDGFYQLVKTRNFDQCQEMPVYNIVAPAGWRCKPGSAVCENVQSRSLVSRYDVCGDIRNGAQLLHVESGEAFITLPLGTRLKTQTVTIDQRLTLSDKRPANVSIGQPTVPNHPFSQSLVFAHPAAGQPSNCSATIVEQVRKQDTMQLQQSDGTDYMLPTNQRPEIGSPIAPADGLCRVVSGSQFFGTAAPHPALFAAAELFAAGSDGSRGSSPTRRPFNQWLMKAIDGSTSRSALVHQLAWLGSDDSLALAKHLMSNKFLSSQDATGLISSLSMFLRTPTDYALDQLLSLLELDLVKGDASLRQTTFVSLASIVRLACIDRKSSRTRFPTQQHGGQFCTGVGRDAIPRRLVQLLAPYLNESRASSGDAMAVLSAFNTLGHESIVDVVLPVIEGRSGDNPSLRSKAVLTLHKLAHAGDQQAVRILHTIYANPSENYEVRMAAFTLLMLSDPPEHIWQNIAIRTWFEPRSHVTSFIYTTLETLASFQSPVRFLRRLSRKARRVLKLAKRPSGRGLHYSSSYIWSYADSREVFGSYLRLETFANKASLFPKELYGRVNFNLGASDFDFLEFEVHGHRMESLLEALLDRMRGDGEAAGTPPSKKCGAASGTDAPVDDVFHRLHVKYHAEQGRGEGYVHSTLMESVERFWSFQGVGLEQLVKDLLSHEDVERRRRLDWFQLTPLVNVDIEWPNSIGWTTRVRVDGHMLTTLNGHYQLQRRSNRLSLQSQLEPTLSLEIDTRLGIDLNGPGDDWLVESGWNLLHLASLPGASRVTIDPLAGRVDAAWTSTSEGTDDQQETMILLHASMCRIQSSNLTTCPAPVTQEAGGATRAGEQVSGLPPWLDALLIQLEQPTGRWLRLLSPLGSCWTPGPVAQSTSPDQTFHRQWIARRSDASAFEFSAQLETDDLERQSTGRWVMISGTKQLTRTAGPAPAGNVGDGIRLTFHGLGTDNGVHVRHLNWTIEPFIGECVIRGDQVETFDGVSYNASLTDRCQYLAAGVVTRDGGKMAVLLERQSAANSGLDLLISDEDRIRVDLTTGQLVVNDLSVPLESGQVFRLQSACRSLVRMRAARNPTGLWLDLPRHGLQLQLTRSAHLHIKARRSLRGKMQGLCGDLNEEKLFEFRSPERCVLSQGRLMAAAYQTRSRCHVPADVWRRLQLETSAANCPRHEGAPTRLGRPFG